MSKADRRAVIFDPLAAHLFINTFLVVRQISLNYLRPPKDVHQGRKLHYRQGRRNENFLRGQNNFCVRKKRGQSEGTESFCGKLVLCFL